MNLQSGFQTTRNVFKEANKKTCTNLEKNQTKTGII